MNWFKSLQPWSGVAHLSFTFYTALWLTRNSMHFGNEMWDAVEPCTTAELLHHLGLLVFFCLFSGCRWEAQSFSCSSHSQYGWDTFFGVGVEIGGFWRHRRSAYDDKTTYQIDGQAYDIGQRREYLRAFIVGLLVELDFDFVCHIFFLFRYRNFFSRLVEFQKKTIRQAPCFVSLYQWNSKSPLSARFCRLIIRVFVSRCWYLIRRSATDCELGED